MPARVPKHHLQAYKQMPIHGPNPLNFNRTGFGEEKLQKVSVAIPSSRLNHPRQEFC
jgi:hypothetical protein